MCRLGESVECIVWFVCVLFLIVNFWNFIVRFVCGVWGDWVIVGEGDIGDSKFGLLLVVLCRVLSEWELWIRDKILWIEIF